MTKEQKRISEQNHKKAVKYFGIEQSKKWEYDLHHVDPNMKAENIERYILWLPEDLVVLTHEEHTRLHMTELLSDERRYKFGKSSRGKHFTEEHRRKLSEANKGKHNHSGVNNPNYGKHKHWKLGEDGKRIYY